MVRHLFNLDLMRVALTPIVPADIKKAAEDALINRLETISTGERLTLARRSSGRIAGELLLDSDIRVMHTALENARLTEALIIKALSCQDAPATFVQAVCHHEKWSLRNEVKMALLANENTPLARALQFANELPVKELKEILLNSRLSPNVKSYLQTIIEKNKT